MVPALLHIYCADSYTAATCLPLAVQFVVAAATLPKAVSGRAHCASTEAVKQLRTP